MIQASDLIAKFQYALDENWGYIWGTAGILWTQARQNASSREMTVKYGSRWIGHTVADCSGLFRWAYKQLGSDIAHGSNSIFDRYCSDSGELKNGKRTDGKELKPGTAVFTGTRSEHGHIGLYIGNGWVIEAKGTQYGVVKSKVTESKWTWWGELKEVLYSAENAPNQPSEPSDDKESLPTLRRGDRGEKVQFLQTILVEEGFDIGKTGIDGIFGAKTEEAVKEFQKKNRLVADGVVGKKTWKALTERDERLYTVTINGLTKEKAEKIAEMYGGVVS